MDAKNCRCENCNRTATSVEIIGTTIQHHTAQLCLACAHVLTLPDHKERFLQLVRKNSYKESNKDMQKVHRFMSLLLAFGALCIVMIATASVSQGFDFASWSTDHLVGKATEYVSFVNINDYS